MITFKGIFKKLTAYDFELLRIRCGSLLGANCNIRIYQRERFKVSVGFRLVKRRSALIFLFIVPRSTRNLPFSNLVNTIGPI